MFVCVSGVECESAHMYVCVFHRSAGGGEGVVGGEIYLSEQRRTGDGEGREGGVRKGVMRGGEGDVPGRQQQERGEKKQEKGKCRKERFIVERGWSILRRDSRAWGGRNK